MAEKVATDRILTPLTSLISGIGDLLRSLEKELYPMLAYIEVSLCYSTSYWHEAPRSVWTPYALQDPAFCQDIQACLAAIESLGTPHPMHTLNELYALLLGQESFVKILQHLERTVLMPRMRAYASRLATPA
jgi:hypothetical protein